MDNRVTRGRLKALFSYDLLKIIGLALAGVLIWSLLFTMLGDSLDEGQKLQIYSYDCYVSTSEENGVNYLLTGEGRGYQSFEVRETRFDSSFGYYGSNAYFGQQFMAWMSVGQLDLWFVSTEDGVVDSGRQDEDGNPIKTSVLQNYADNYADIIYYAREAVEYCASAAGYDGASFGGQKLEVFFQNRMRRDKFYRHGLVSLDDEKDRFIKIYKYASELLGWYESGEDIFLTVTRSDGSQVICGIDMEKLALVGPDEKTGFKASDLCKRNQESESVGGVGLAMFDVKNKQSGGDLFYESLSFIAAVVEEFSAL